MSEKKQNRETGPGLTPPSSPSQDKAPSLPSRMGNSKSGQPNSSSRGKDQG